MKSKEERVLSMIRSFLKVYGGDKREAEGIFIRMNNPLFKNVKLSTDERRIIGNEVKKHVESGVTA